MAANPFPLSIRAHFPTRFCAHTLAFTHFPNPKFIHSPLLLLCRCAAALTVNGTHSAAAAVFPDSGIMLFQLFQEMGFSDKDTASILEANEALRSMPSEYIPCRVQLLQAAGLNGAALSRVIVKRPDVLTSPEIDAFLATLLRDDALDLKGKIEPVQIERLLTGTDPRLLVGFGKKLGLLLDVGISKENLVKVVNSVNLIKAFCLKSLEEMEKMFAYLRPFGGVDLVLRRPAVLNYDLETQLMPRIGYLFELSGRDEVATATVLRKFPSALAYSVDHLKDHVEFLKSFGGLSYEEIFRVVVIYPSLFSTSRKRKLHPRIDFLKKCGLNSNDIYKFLIKAPLFLSLSFEENLANKLVFLVKIGYEDKTRELAMALGAVTRCSCKNLQGVIGVYLNYGLTCEDILDMSKKHPQVLQYNHESLEEKFEYLTEEMGREVGEVLSFPAFLGYKLDGRIKHRYEERRKVLGEGMSINKLLSVSTASFATKSGKKLPATTIFDADETELNE